MEIRLLSLVVAAKESCIAWTFGKHSHASVKKITLTKVGRKTMQIGHLTGSKVSQLQHRQQLRFALVIRDNSVSLEDLCVLWRKQRKNWTTCGVSKTSKDGKWASNNSTWKWLTFWRLDQQRLDSTKAAMFPGCTQKGEITCHGKQYCLHSDMVITGSGWQLW